MKPNHTLRISLLLLSLLWLSACSEDLPLLEPISTDATVLAFGDSLTYGTGASAGNDYPTKLARLNGLPVINAGVPGEMSSTGLQRLPDLLAEHEPELLILIHGGNDLLRKKSPEALAENLRQMIRLAQDSEVQVVMMAVPKPGLLLGPTPLYQEVAAEMSVPIDAETLADILQYNDTKSDTIHPNNAGYQIMAENLHQLLMDHGAY